MKKKSTRFVLFGIGMMLVACTADSPPVVEASPATPAQIDRVSAGLEEGFALRHVYTARSQAHERAFFVAGEMVGPGASGQVGVWMHLGTPEDMGPTMSVNGYAEEFSDWPEGSSTAASVTMRDLPARELQRFVEQRVQSAR